VKRAGVIFSFPNDFAISGLRGRVRSIHPPQIFCDPRVQALRVVTLIEESHSIDNHYAKDYSCGRILVSSFRNFWMNRKETHQP
jgi:hypothetical protein